MRGKITNPTSAGGNNVPAIGTPVARLFFEPQNNNTIASSRHRPSHRPPPQHTAKAVANSPQLINTTAVKLNTDTRDHSPPTTAALKAVYTTNKIVPRSNCPTSDLWRPIQPAIHGLAK